MSFFHQQGLNGKKACGIRKKSGVEDTKESLKYIEDKILPFANLGFRLTETQVFWCPMVDSQTMANTFGRRDWTRGAVDHAFRVEKDADNNPWHFINGGLLEAARPPDSIFGSPQ